VSALDSPDFDDVHRRLVPERLARPEGQAAARDVVGIGSIAFRLLDGRAYRLGPTTDGIAVDPSDDAATIVDLDLDAWRQFVTELATAAGLFYAGRLAFARGSFADLERWEPALRALVDGRPIFDPAGVVDGPDPHRAYTLDAPAETLRAALDANGYVLVKRVFREDEIARLIDVVETWQARARPGDGRSWWARRADGTSVLCRLIYLGLVSPEVAVLDHDPRIACLLRLVRGDLRPAVDRADGHSVVLKHGQVADGLADLPWHRDCGLGGHPVTCPKLNIGVQLDAATAASGQLHVVPGSWRYSCHRADLPRARTIALDTEPGDCTVHLGDVMHAAPPPSGSGPGRRALYLTGMPPVAFDVIPPGKSYNDVILARVGR
jgi:ectoine hydroxylase-related dioxygenase (phytanoyl-CoA dioxygenase family)